MVMSLGDLRGKFEAFGWEVVELTEGNNMEKVLHTLETAKALSGKGKPICILLHTAMGSGVSFMEGTHEWHGIAPNDAQLAQALQELVGINSDY
jgi:transketolase